MEGKPIYKYTSRSTHIHSCVGRSTHIHSCVWRQVPETEPPSFVSLLDPHSVLCIVLVVCVVHCHEEVYLVTDGDDSGTICQNAGTTKGGKDLECALVAEGAGGL